MCDFDQIYTLLAIGEGLIIAAMIGCGVAIGLNLAGFTAATAAIVFGAALAAGLAASLGLASVTTMLAQCGSSQCATEASAALGWMITVTGALATALAVAYAAVFFSAIPFGGAGPMAAYGVFLAGTAALLPSAVGALQALQRCQAASQASSAAPAALAGIAAFVGVVGIVAMLLASGRARQPKPGESPRQPID